MTVLSQKTERVTLAMAIVRFLAAQRARFDDVEDRFVLGMMGIFGHGNVAGIGQALEESAALPFLQPKNEQAMVHTAAAFAKARRRRGILACTTSVGPGATNMVTAAAAATINRLPVLLLPGDTFAGRWPHPVLQQLEHPSARDVSVNDCFRPVSKLWDRIQRPEQILDVLPEAMRVLLDPAEAGAVTLCLPEDVQAEAFDCPSSFFATRVHTVDRRPPVAARIAEAAALLRRAERPLVIAGGGVHYSDATAALRRFVDDTRIPVAVTQAGMGALTAEHTSWVGGVGVTGTGAANALAERADVVVVIGTRLSDFTTASKAQFQNDGVRFIAINVNAADAHKLGALPIVADARAALEALQSAIRGHRFDARPVDDARSAWLQDRAALVAGADGGPLSQAQVIDAVNTHQGARGTVVHAAGGLPGDLHKLWLSRDVDDYHAEYGYSCMGYEVAGALGVKLARPEREVMALVGDGSYLMMANELLTAVQEGVKITVLLVDNHGYQCIENLQVSCGGRSFGNALRARAGEPSSSNVLSAENTTTRLDGPVLAVDFMANASSLGARALQARTLSELRAALETARAEPRPCLVYVPLAEASKLPGTSWWDVPVAAVSDVASVRAAREAYETALLRRRFLY